MIPSHLSDTMIDLRIYSYLLELYDLRETSPKKIRSLYTDFGEVSNIDDITDIYIQENILNYFRDNKDTYLKRVMESNERVLAFRPDVKRKLMLSSEIDMNIAETIFLDLGMSTTCYPVIYINEIYDNIFMDKMLEEKIVSSQFDIDKLLEEFSLKDKITTTNDRFIYIYRSHFSYDYVRNILFALVDFKESDFDDDNPDFHYNRICYELNLISLQAYLMLLNREDYEQVKKDYLSLCGDNPKNKYIERVGQLLNEEGYQKVKKILNL